MKKGLASVPMGSVSALLWLVLGGRTSAGRGADNGADSGADMLRGGRGLAGSGSGFSGKGYIPGRSGSLVPELRGLLSTSFAHRSPGRVRFGRVLSVSIWSPAARTGRVRHVELKVSSRSQGDRTIVALAGEIDLYTAPRLQSELAAAIAAGDPARLIVDMSGVEFCDSTGMNVLLAAHRRAREQGGDLELTGPRPAVRKILQVTGLETVFTVIENPAAVQGP